MITRWFRVLTLAALVLPGGAWAQEAEPAAVGSGSRFTLAAPSQPAALRAAPLRAATRSQQAMPRELPEVRADDALPPPVFLWRPARGAVLKVKPAKLRFNWDF